MSNREDLTNKAKHICSERGFDFLKKVGDGAFKDTFKVQINGDEKALKVYQKNVDIDRVDREIDSMTTCNFDHIAKIDMFDEIQIHHETHYFCIEEFLDGGTLLDRIINAPIQRAKIIELGNMMINTLEYLSSLRLIHRDIKPENILFRNNDWNLILTDFGIVRDLNKDSLTATHFKWGLGTPGYAPKEQMENDKPIIGWRCDQFATGVTLGAAATRIHPFNMDIDNVRLGKISQEFVNSINSIKLPVILKMISLWPVDRYGSVNQLRKAWNEQG